MNALRPTWYSAASAIHQSILARIDEYREVARDAKLRFIRSGSGRLDPKVMAGLEEAFGAPVVERYGMSETGNLAANPLPPEIRKPGSVGHVVGNEVAIVDENGTVMGPNTEGEIVARGPSVFDGYLDNPEATAAAFLNGWFRTGDLGRFDDDGYLIITGRLKDVINRGGEKIGTAEVEAALLQHPEIIEALTQQEVQAFARGQLVGSKVPKRVFFLPSLPKSATNKIRRRETAARCLELLKSAPLEQDAAPSRAWSPLEREIAAGWKRVLGIEEIGLDDDFFMIGGDSLQASELFARFHQNYRIALNLGQIFEEASTVAGMARLIERSRSERSKAPRETGGMVTINASGNRSPLFVVPGTTGNPVGFIHLARLLDPRQPMIGIESRGMDGIETPLTRMQDVAADNVARMRKIQPQGPYFLAGQCFGGRVVYEMARQLEAAGERVGMLFMLDASSPFFNRQGQRRGEQTTVLRRTSRWDFLTRYVLDRMKRHVNRFMRLKGPERRAFIREKFSAAKTILQTGDLFRGDRRQFARRAVYAANLKVGRNYVPGTFGGPTILCLTRDREIKGPRNYRLDWLTLVPQIGAPVYMGGRDSGDMQNPPYVYELADLINRELEAVYHLHAAVAPASRRAVASVAVG